MLAIVLVNAFCKVLSNSDLVTERNVADDLTAKSGCAGLRVGTDGAPTEGVAVGAADVGAAVGTAADELVFRSITNTRAADTSWMARFAGTVPLAALISLETRSLRARRADDELENALVFFRPVLCIVWFVVRISYVRITLHWFCVPMPTVEVLLLPMEDVSPVGSDARRC